MVIIRPPVWTQQGEGWYSARHRGTHARVTGRGRLWRWSVGHRGRDDYRAGQAPTRDRAFQAAEEELYNR